MQDLKSDVNSIERALQELRQDTHILLDRISSDSPISPKDATREWGEAMVQTATEMQTQVNELQKALALDAKLEAINTHDHKVSNDIQAIRTDIREEVKKRLDSIWKAALYTPRHDGDKRV